MAAGQFVKSPYVFINSNISQVGTIPGALLSLLLCSKRGVINTDGITLSSLDFDLYKPFQIPGQYLGSGADALSYLASLGATVNYGINSDIVLVAPDAATVVGSTTQLTWDVEPEGWQDLLVGSISGTVAQIGPSSGVILSVSQAGYILTLGSVTGTFTTSNVISVNYLNSAISVPNGLTTETFALDVYYAVEAMNLQNTLNLSFGSPTLSVSLVSDRDDPFSANGAAVSLGVPDDVVVNGDGTVSIFYDTAPANWIYVPQTALGATTLTQVVSTAVGTLVQQLAPQFTPTGEGVGLLLNDITGTFNTTNIVSLNLDDTITTFSLLNNNYYKFVQMTYEVAEPADFTTTYLEFVDYILSVNAAQSASNGLFGTFGVFGVSSVSYSNYLSTAAPNSNLFIYPNYYYPGRFGDVSLQAGQMAASLAGALACNLPPYNPMDGIVLNGLPISTDPSTYVNISVPGGQAEALLQFGQTPIAVNPTLGKAYIWNPVTTETTIPGSNVTDQEFYDVGTWQVVNEIKYRANAAVKSPIFLNTRITPKLLLQLNNAIYTMLKQAEAETMIFNVDALKPSITVILNPVDPHGVIISFEIQIAPALTGVTININLISALITPPTTQA